MEFVFLWLACAVIAALAAGSRNRSALAWFFLGFLFGPLAVIAVLVMGRADPAG